MASRILLAVVVLTVSCISLSNYAMKVLQPILPECYTSQKECPSSAQREAVIDEVKEDIRNTLLQIHSKPSGPSTGGVVYTRWGRTTCPSTSGTQQLYAGRAAGSHYTDTGGGANYLCLPEQPQYSNYTAGTQTGRAFLYGTEYQAGGVHQQDSGPISFGDENVPCAVCYVSTRGTVVMIPAQITCPSSWTREYYGYLMADYHGYQRTMFECVDRSPQIVPGNSADTNGALFYHVEVKCNGIPCPPYDTQKEVTCVVCTK